MRQANILTPRNGRITVLVPETEHERARGVGVGLPRPYSGMMFEFNPPSDAVMTMKNTPMPLQLAFFDPHGVAHAAFNVLPRSGDYRSGRPTRWVVETFAGWNVFRPGDRLLIGV